MTAVAPTTTREAGSDAVRSAAEMLRHAQAFLRQEGPPLTIAHGPLAVNDEHRNLLVLFESGRFLVSQSHRWDPRVLGFEAGARKRGFEVGDKEPVPMALIKAVYDAVADPGRVDGGRADEEMQREFVALIKKAVAAGASDVHVAVRDVTQVRFRVGGIMRTVGEADPGFGRALLRTAFNSADVSDRNYAEREFQAAQKLGGTPLGGPGGRLRLPSAILGIRMQFNPLAFGGREGVFRVLCADGMFGGDEETVAGDDLSALGFDDYELELFRRMRMRATGLVIVSGPTGHGKSTTLQRNLTMLLQERDYRIACRTVEDPPELPITGAVQTQVVDAAAEADQEVLYQEAISAALRSDLDVLMVSEIRSLKSADMVFRGAMSGHAVWTTLHAPTAPGCLVRLRDLGVETFKLRDPELYTGLVSQRLVRRLCRDCRMPATEVFDARIDEIDRIVAVAGGDAMERVSFAGPGCEACNHEGYRGRTVIAEILMPDAQVMRLAIEGDTRRAVERWVRELGGRTLGRSGVERMLAGEVDLAEVERWTGLLDPRTHGEPES